VPNDILSGTKIHIRSNDSSPLPLWSVTVVDYRRIKVDVGVGILNIRTFRELASCSSSTE